MRRTRNIAFTFLVAAAIYALRAPVYAKERCIGEQGSCCNVLWMDAWHDCEALLESFDCQDLGEEGCCATWECPF